MHLKNCGPDAAGTRSGLQLRRNGTFSTELKQNSDELLD
jgi:hypothetical protein